MLNVSSINLWLAVGLILIIIEFLKLPGIGFLFLGFGALTNAAILSFYPKCLEFEYINFGLSSAIWFILLWKPLKDYERKKTTEYKYSDILGKEVTVVSTILSCNVIGQVQWSGTIMNAKLKDNEVNALAGETLYILEIDGNILFCSRDLPTVDIDII